MINIFHYKLTAEYLLILIYYRHNAVNPTFSLSDAYFTMC